MPASHALTSGHLVLVAVIVGVTWMAVIGAALGVLVLRAGPPPAVPAEHGVVARGWAIYELNWPVPTTFGSLAVSAADLNVGGSEDVQAGAADEQQPTVASDQVLVQLSVDLTNEQDTIVDAPRFEDFRLVSTYGSVADLVPTSSSTPGALSPRSTSSASLAFLAPREGAVLWLEYSQNAGERPIRVAVGWPDRPAPEALEPPPPAPWGDGDPTAPDISTIGA